MPRDRLLPVRIGAARRLWPALLGLFLTVLGARFWLVWTYGSAMPYWDQWPAEGLLIIKPWLEGKLHLDALLALHLEHRIFLTRVLVLGLLAGNGQWDAQLEMAVNAGLCALLAVVFAAGLLRVFGPAYRGGILWGLALVFALPFGWENTLGGFQSQFYFLLGSSVLALWGLIGGRAFSATWWAGVAGAVLACFSMGSGFFAAAVALCFGLLRTARAWQRPSMGEWATWAFCLLVLAVSWHFRGQVQGDLQVQSPHAWSFAFGRCLGWPRSQGAPDWGLLGYCPLALLAILYLREPPRLAPERRRAELLLSLGAWLGLQCAAMALARGGADGHLSPPSRYMDLLAAGALVNGLAAWLLAGRVTAGSWRRPAALGLAGIWTVACLAGVAELTRVGYSVDLPAKRDLLRTEEQNVRAFVNGDPEALKNKPLMDIPYPVPEHLAGMLSDPTLRPTLPAVVRERLRVEAASGEGGAFTPGALPAALGAGTPENAQAWGSYGPDGAAGRGQLRARLAPSPRLPYLQWQFAGGLGGDAALTLRLEGGEGREGMVLRPARVAGERWRTEFLPVPGTDLRLVAEDNSATGWFAFRPPVEVGRWSYWSGWLLRRGVWLFGAGVALLLGGTLGRWVVHRLAHRPELGGMSK